MTLLLIAAQKLRWFEGLYDSFEVIAIQGDCDFDLDEADEERKVIPEREILKTTTFWWGSTLLFQSF